MDELQAGIKTARRNINMKTSDMQMTPPLWQEATELDIEQQTGSK